jgi:hypothetical protein
MNNKEYNIKDKVWVHIGERTLTEGRVVDIVNLAHLGEGHDPADEIYLVEIKTGIEDIYEARRWNEISPDARGPINLFRKTNVQKEQRYLKKVGVILPIEQQFNPLADSISEDPLEPTADQITAALVRSEQSSKHQTMSPEGKPKRRTFKKKKPL